MPWGKGTDRRAQWWKMPVRTVKVYTQKKNMRIFPFWKKKSHNHESWSADWKNNLKEGREKLPVWGQHGESWWLHGNPGLGVWVLQESVRVVGTRQDSWSMSLSQEKKLVLKYLNQGCPVDSKTEHGLEGEQKRSVISNHRLSLLAEKFCTWCCLNLPSVKSFPKSPAKRLLLTFHRPRRCTIVIRS